MFSGNQETLADPVRPVVYFGEGPWVYVIDVATGATVDSILVNGEAESLDMSRDANSLYVAFARSNKIAIIDIPSWSVRREIPLNFTPLSVRVGRPDRLYISNAPNETQPWGYLYVLNESSGTVIQSVYISFAAALEVSPNASVLLTAWLFISPGEISRYDITTDNATLTASYYGPYFGRQSVDWARNRMYVGSAVISLITMEVVETLYLSNPLVSAAFSPNGSRLYGVAATPYGPARSLWAHDFVTGWETSASLADGTGWVVVSRDGRNLIVGKPVHRVWRGASLTPSYPRPSAVLNSTPGWVSATLDFGLPVMTVANLTVSLDGARLEHRSFAPGIIEGIVNTTLVDGNHTVDYGIDFEEGGSCGSAWEFRIYANMTPPSVDAVYPARDGVEKRMVSYIEATLDHGDPPQPIESVTMYVDGRSVAVSFKTPDLLRANLSFPLGDGTHEVFGVIDWNGGAGGFYWRFSVRVEIPPRASFAFVPASFFVGDRVTFDASGSEDVQGTIIEYLWEFGDGVRDLGRIAKHSYSRPGTFLVRLTILDNRNLTSTAEMEVSPAERPAKPVPVLPLVFSAISMATAIAIAALASRRRKPEPGSSPGPPPRWYIGTPSAPGFCIHCGSPSEPRDAFCHECGHVMWRPPA